jgi:hypothetical protein
VVYFELSFNLAALAAAESAMSRACFTPAAPGSLLAAVTLSR